MSARNTEPIEYDGFPKGVDNLRSDDDVPEGALRGAVNVDVLSSGRVRMRRGIRQRVADAGAHSIFGDGSRLVWATANALRIADRNLVTSTLLTNAALAVPLSYLSLHGEIYFSNEYINGKVNALNQYEPWGITPPTAAPALSAATGSRYVQITCAFVARRRALDGSTVLEQSGAPKGAVVACEDAPYISVTSIPQSTDSRVTHTRIYVTGLNGKVFYAHTDVPAGVTACTIHGPFGTGMKLDSQFLKPPPPGQFIDYCLGRIYVASGSNVFHTEALRYGLYDPADDYFMYPERITLLRAVEDGLYISSSDTRFVAGIGSANVRNELKFPYKAIEGESVRVPDSKDVMWLSERGLVRAGPGGGVKNLTEDQLAIDRGHTRVAMGVHEFNGHKAVVAIMKGSEPNPLVSTDYIAAEALRRAEAE